MLVIPTHTAAEAAGAEVAVLPIGSHEQHGEHLPLATDTVIACTIAEAVGAAHPVLRLPPVTISCSHEHAAWPGTVSISATTLFHIVDDVAASLRASGIEKLVLINGHGGNYVLSNIVQQSAGLALFPSGECWDDVRAAAGLETSAYSDMHAGELETSILLHAHPDLVRPGYETADELAEDRRDLLTLGLSAYTESGVVGRPSLATAAKGRDVLDRLVEAFGDCLDALERSRIRGR
ncbi:creatininase family protein [Amycolatopsis magusensis]|uniref:creatininase family protein n=1 Tax=Amycolatopsis magusensis TaxID=882444 RepID=UPI0024A8BB7B|nr:creatininase family protein [Amycolatopsis magusensis]MDI5978279.1 creatininase family protein [Amycolatopsis magusensis]